MNSDHQRSSTYDLLAGHLGHLSEEQLKFFNAFKENLTKATLYRPPTDAEHASHDEATLLCVSSSTTMQFTYSHHSTDGVTLFC